MRNPEFGNRFKFIPNTRMHRNLNGELRTYQGVIPTWEGFSVEYKALSKADLDTIETFLLTSVGELITLTDFEGRDWTGVITSQQIVITEGRDSCNWSIGFEFEGQVTGDLHSVAPKSGRRFDTGFGVSTTIPTPQNFWDSPLFGIWAAYDLMDAQHNTVSDGGTVSSIGNEGNSTDLTIIGSGTAKYRKSMFNGAGAIELFGKEAVNTYPYPLSYTAFIVAQRLGTLGKVFSDYPGHWNLGWEGDYADQAKAGLIISNPAVAPDHHPHLYVMTNTGGYAQIFRDTNLIAHASGAFSPMLGVRLGNAYIGAVAIYAGLLSEDQIASTSYRLMGSFGVPIVFPP